MPTLVSRTDKPPRVQERPNPREWEEHELLTLAEAAALFWPNGPLTVRSLRTAVRDEILQVTWIAGKIFTTPESIRLMARPKNSPNRPMPSLDTASALTSRKKKKNPATAEATSRLLNRLKEHKSRLKPPHARPAR